LILLVQSCKKEKPTTPIITTSVVTSISYNTANSGGEVTDNGGSPVTSQGVCWTTSSDPTIADNKTTEWAGTGTFNSKLTQLAPNTIYYVRAYATNIVGTGYGEVVTFTTNEASVPILTTVDTRVAGPTDAYSGGIITDDMGSSIISRGVCWGTTSNPTIENPKTTEGTGIGLFYSEVRGLRRSTTYYIRAYATNNIGTGYGNELSFTTKPEIPFLTTSEAALLTQNTTSGGGNILNDGGAVVTSRGVCWSTAQYPTVSDSKTVDGTGTGSFNSVITGLTVNTTYYVRAYATNIAGTAYGDNVSFRTISNSSILFLPGLWYELITDIDGNMYKAITIGTQTWMAENLKTTKYNDGTAIPNVTDGKTWYNLTTPAYCWYDNNGTIFKNNYGALYNWYAVNTGKLCLTGWHVPTDSEWIKLAAYLGGESVAGGKLKEIGSTHWASPNSGATNETGFSALPGGSRGGSGINYNIGYYCYWWSSTESSSTIASYWILGYKELYVTRFMSNKFNGNSVRCVKDN